MAKKKQTARAAPPARIGRKGPPLGHPMPEPKPRTGLVGNLALGKSVDNFVSYMQRADYGDTGALMDVYFDSFAYDAHLDGVSRKRTQSMMGRPIAFRPPDGFETDKDALETAAFVRRILLNETRFVTSPGIKLGFRSSLQHLMGGAATSYAVAPIEWTRNKDGYSVPHLFFEHPNRFGFHRDTLEIGNYTGSYRSGWSIRPLSDRPDQFVVHVPMNGRSDYPWRRAPMRSCIVPSFIKRHGIAFSLVLAERFGMPMPFAIVPEGEDHDDESSDDTVATVKAALMDLNQTWSAVFTKGIEINSIPGSGNVKAEVHKMLIDWAEMTQSIALLGQNLSTKVEGGSFAAAEAHRYVAGDIHLADAVELGETITQQLIEPLVRYNRPGSPIPVCEISTGQKQVFTTEHVIQGICSTDELRRTLGHEALADGAGSELRVPEVGGSLGKPGRKPGPEPVGEATPEVTTDPTLATDLAPVTPTAPAAEPEAPIASVDAPAENVQQTALNGAQVQGLKDTASDVVAGLLPPEAAKLLIALAYPDLPKAQVDAMIDAAAAFKPTAPVPPASPPPFPGG